GAFLFTAAFVFLVDNIFNFNPLLELDGYYMLVDILDKPLLRARSLAFVRGPLFNKLLRREPLDAEERLLALFGVATTVYAVFAIVVAVHAWQALVLPLIVSGWQSSDLLPRIAVVLVVIVLAAAIGLTLFGLATRLLQPLPRWLTWL